MSLLKKIAQLLGLAHAGEWAENELTKALNEADKIAAKVFGSAAGRFVIAVATALDPITGPVLTDAEKLFKAAQDTVDYAKAQGATMPFATAIRLAQNAYEQIEKDAAAVKADLDAFVEQAKHITLPDVAGAVASAATATA